MEAAPLIIGVVSKLAKVATVTYENWKQSKDLKKDLEYIQEEMQMMNALIKDYSEADNDQGKRLEKEWIRGVQNLAYDIEDCIDVFEHSLGSSGHRAAALPILSALPLVNMVDPRTQFATEIQKFKDIIKETAERRNKWAPFNTNINGNPPPASVSPEQYAREADLEGIDQPKMELLELLEEAATGQQASMQLKVISIVGCRGLGKTALARAVYETDGFDEKFPCRAWVVASNYNWNDAGNWELFLRDILRQVDHEGGDTTTSDAAQLKEYLTTHLKDKRYLIVIDDVQRVKHWTTMKSAFPNNDKSSRIIVTTSVKSVATTCSSGSYLYGMKALGKEQSRNLFWKKVFGDEKAPSREQDRGSKNIIDKCDGLPLALVSTAQVMFSKPEKTGTVCEQVCADLGNRLVAREADDGLEEIKRVLKRSYYSLPSQDLKNCLLSVSIFPRNYQINRKRLVRRWLAEGFVHTEVGNKEDTADKFFEELIDQHVIQPVDISNNAKVKKCQVHGIMLDFIVNMSASEKFITLIHSGNSMNGSGPTARRLCLHDTSAERVMETIHGLSRIRSLAIFKHVGPKLLDFRRCEFLRVLDLEDCKELKDSVLNSICKLLQLRYLSLRGTDISKIPKKISRLELLDTLDLRGTKVALLPMEVLTLPRLAHLFGRFQLPRELNRAKRKLQESFSKKSELQTLAGFEMNNSSGFEQIIRSMSKLRKVKVCSKCTPTRELTHLLVSSLQERFKGTDALKFLSVDFDGISVDFMDSLKAPCLLYSIKLRGTLTTLPGFINKSLETLKELSLFSTRLDGSVLQALQDLPCLNYLKLVDDAFKGNFDVRRDGFPSIHRLCFKARDRLPEVHIAKGAMQHLSLLQLLCKKVDGVDVAEIAHLRDLKEVTLHTSVNDDTKKAWKTAASLHDNRPKISYHTETIDDPTADGRASS